MDTPVSAPTLRRRHVTGLGPLVQNPDMDNAGWRGEVGGRLASLRTVIALEGTIGGFERHAEQRAEIRAALVALTQAIDTALLGLARGELPVFQLSATARADAARRRLRKALEALTVAVVDRDQFGAGFAC